MADRDGFDVTIDGIGFPAAWDWARQNDYPSALLDISEEGDVPFGSTPAGESAPALVREKSDWYVWSVTNWQHGSGQRSQDAEQALDGSFFQSTNVDIERQGELTLTPAAVSLVNPVGMLPTGKICSGLGKIWCVFRQGQNDRLAYLSGTSWVFPSGQPYNGGIISALCCDGAFVYAAWPDSSIMQFRTTTAITTAYVTRVVAMCVSAGMLCIAREGVRGETGVPNGASAGYLNYSDPRAYVPCTPTLGETPSFITMPDMGIVAMAPEGTWVYLLTVNGQDSHVYRYQPLTGVFEDAAGFASGFVATCLCSAVASVFIGGYYHPGLDDAGVELTDCGIGAIYMHVPGAGVELLTDIGRHPSVDSRVTSIAPHGKRLSILSGPNLLHWDLVLGGWHQRGEARGNA